MESLSIHPRNWKNQKDGVKKNTAGPSSIKKRMAKMIEGLERHIENNPRDGEAQKRLGNAKSRMG
jgi:ribosomal protein S15P/S13E